MTVAPLYLSFIENKREVKIKTLISFERPCYSTRQLAKTKEVKLRKHEDIEVLLSLFFFQSIEIKDVESYEPQTRTKYIEVFEMKTLSSLKA